VKKLLERLIEGLLMMSSMATTVTVLLIIVFLFREGVSVFNETPLEGNNVISVHRENPVEVISPAEIKAITDGKITHWKSLGGDSSTITLITFNDLGNFFSEEELGSSFERLPFKIDSLIGTDKGMLVIFPEKYLRERRHTKTIKMPAVGVNDFLFGREWFPTAHPAVQLGVWPLITGTLVVSLIAILIALPIGLSAAIYMAEVADKRMRNFLKPVIELLAGIPSVVYGFFGLIVVVPFIQDFFGLPVGETALAGSLLLAIMALPTIITISEDALRNTPRAMKEASLALGANRWQTILRVSLPYSISGISAAAILGIGRAIGETMAVLMVTGNAAIMPTSLLQPVRTIPATIAAELGEAPQGGVHYKALFTLGCILFIMTLIINLSVEFISKNRHLNK